MEDAAQAIHTLIQQLSALYSRDSDQILQEQLGIGYSQYKILGTLRDNPATQQKHIAFQLGQTEASVSRQIKLLERRGLLGSKVNPANKREHITTLTMKGERLTEAASTALQNYQLSSLAHMSRKHQAQLLELLATVHA